MESNVPDLGNLSLDGPAPVDYSSDEDVVIIGHATRAPRPKKTPEVVDLTTCPSDDEPWTDSTIIPDDNSTWPYHNYHANFINLHHAVIAGDLNLVKSVFEREKHPAGLRQLRIDAMNEHIQQAIANDHGDVVAYLIRECKGQVYDHHIETAIKFRSFKALESFLDRGWDINRRRSSGQPGFLTVAAMDLEVAEWFLNHGASPNATCKYDITPLSLIIRDAPLPMIEHLFQRGGSVNHGQLLHYAAWRYKPDSVAVAKLLLSKGSDINAMKFALDPIAQKALGGTKFCGTPLAEAARAGHVGMVQFLLENGADPWIDQTQHQAWSPHAWAQYNVMKDPKSKAYQCVLELLMLRMYGSTSGYGIEAGPQPGHHQGTRLVQA